MDSMDSMDLWPVGQIAIGLRTTVEAHKGLGDAEKEDVTYLIPYRRSDTLHSATTYSG